MKLTWLQETIWKWTALAFGERFAHEDERVARAVEEVVELAQAIALPREFLHKIVDSVYERPAGNASQELGGALLTLLAAAEALDFDAEECLMAEAQRVLTTDIMHFKKRNAKKVAGGTSVVHT